MDKSNPLFTLAQDALEKERKDQQHDVTQKVSKRISSSESSFLFTSMLTEIVRVYHSIA